MAKKPFYLCNLNEDQKIEVIVELINLLPTERLENLVEKLTLLLETKKS